MNKLKMVSLRYRKTVIHSVTVVKFRVKNGGDNNTGCFEINVRTEHGSSLIKE